MVRCAVWCHVHNLKNVINTHGGVLPPPWVFFTFFKLYEWYQIAQNRENFVSTKSYYDIDSQTSYGNKTAVCFS